MRASILSKRIPSLCSKTVLSSRGARAAKRREKYSLRFLYPRPPSLRRLTHILPTPACKAQQDRLKRYCWQAIICSDLISTKPINKVMFSVHTRQRNIKNLHFVQFGIVKGVNPDSCFFLSFVKYSGYSLDFCRGAKGKTVFQRQSQKE